LNTGLQCIKDRGKVAADVSTVSAALGLQAEPLLGSPVAERIRAGSSRSVNRRLKSLALAGFWWEVPPIFHDSDDLAPLDSKPKVSEEVTDAYLADLAAKHGFKFGTLDGGIKHPMAELIG
jgi:predicted nucleic acid-binding protein